MVAAGDVRALRSPAGRGAARSVPGALLRTADSEEDFSFVVGPWAEVS